MKYLNPDFKFRSFKRKLKECTNLENLVSLHNKLWHLQEGANNLQKEAMYVTVKKMVEKRIKELHKLD